MNKDTTKAQEKLLKKIEAFSKSQLVEYDKRELMLFSWKGDIEGKKESTINAKKDQELITRAFVDRGFTIRQFFLDDLMPGEFKLVHLLREAVYKPEKLTVAYFTSHGVKNKIGELGLEYGEYNISILANIHIIDVTEALGYLVQKIAHDEAGELIDYRLLCWSN